MPGKLLDTTVLIDLSRGNAAATALTEALELASDNDRHFKVIPGLTVSRSY